MKSWTTEEIERLRTLVDDGLSWQQIAEQLDRSVDSTYKKYKRLLEDPTPDSTGDPEKWEVDSQGDRCSIVSISDSIRTVDQALARAEVDKSLWDVARVRVNSWEVAGKKRTGDPDNPEELWSRTLFQVRVDLVRRAPKPIQEGIRELLSELRDNPSPLPKMKRPKTKDPHLLEMSLFDAHFGKLCWGEEVDDSDYDLSIAKDVFVNAVHDLLRRFDTFDIEKILFPVGSDFFHANNWISETARGTLVESTDDRFQKVFRAGCSAVQRAIEACREVADVECIWVPGNHDTATSWYLCEWLGARFWNDDHVTVDAGPTHRKYRQYGRALLGYTHGGDEKMRDLPLMMATEVPDLWADSEYRHWRCGHWHKKARFDFTAGDTFNGVHVDILPSLSGTDHWHYKHGFVRNSRTAEAYLWSRETGYVGHFSTCRY